MPSIGSADLLGDLHARIQKCNERMRSLKALPPIVHDGDLDKFERLHAERLTEEVSIMAEALDVMKKLDALMSPDVPVQRLPPTATVERK